MALLELLLTIGAAAGLTYFGKKNNEEAEARNEQSKKIALACDQYINEVNRLIEQRKEYISNYLIAYGQMKNDFITNSLSRYCKLMNENFTNFNAVIKASEEKYNDLEIESINDIQNGIKAIESKTKSTDYTTNADFKKAVAISLGTFGVGIAVSSLTGTAASIFTLANSLSFIPLSFGIGYGAAGYLNNYRSKQNYSNAIEQQQKLIEMEPKIKEMFDYLDTTIKGLQQIACNAADILNNFEVELILLEEETKNENSDLYSSKDNKIDASKLKLQDKKRLRYLYAVSRITYTSLDIPLFFKNGNFIKSSPQKFSDNVKLIESEGKKYYGE